MNPEQNHARVFYWPPTLHGDLPEALVKCQHVRASDSALAKYDDVVRTGQIRASPQNVLPFGSKRVQRRLREVLIGEKAHLRWYWERLVFAGKIAGVR